MAIHLLINPIAGNGRGARLPEQVPADWIIHFIDLHNTQTYIPETIVEHDTVIIAGGDGTIHLVLNFFHKHHVLKNIVFGIIPLGTGNDIARSLGLLDQPLSALVKLYTEKQKTLRFPLWKYNDHLFCAYLSIGYDAKILHDVMRWRKHLPKKAWFLLATFFVSALKNLLLNVRPDQLSIRKLPHGPVKSMIISNSTSYAGGSYIETHPDKNVLSVVILENSFDVLKLNWTRFSTKPLRPTYYVESMTIEKNEAPTQADGETLAHGPAEITLADHVFFIVGT